MGSQKHAAKWGQGAGCDTKAAQVVSAESVVRAMRTPDIFGSPVGTKNCSGAGELLHTHTGANKNKLEYYMRQCLKPKERPPNELFPITTLGAGGPR